jgi:hypothetical protein
MAMRVSILPGSDQNLALTQRRLERNTWLALAAMMAIALVIGKLSVILGVALGGALGILNHRWLSSSLGGILTATSSDGAIPRGAAIKFVLRFVIIGGGIAAALWSRMVDLLAIVAGFSAFLVAVMIEAGYQIFLILTRRGE